MHRRGLCTRRPAPAARIHAESYFKTQAEMAELFADIPEALANSVEIARRCNLALELGKSRLPPFPTPAGVSLEDYLAQQAEQGLACAWQNFSPRRGRGAPAANPNTAPASNSRSRPSIRWATPATF